MLRAYLLDWGVIHTSTGKSLHLLEGIRAEASNKRLKTCQTEEISAFRTRP